MLSDSPLNVANSATPKPPMMMTHLRPIRSESTPAGMLVRKRPMACIENARPKMNADPPMSSMKRGITGMTIIIDACAEATSPPTIMTSSRRSPPEMEVPGWDESHGYGLSPKRRTALGSAGSPEVSSPAKACFIWRMRSRSQVFQQITDPFQAGLPVLKPFPLSFYYFSRGFGQKLLVAQAFLQVRRGTSLLLWPRRSDACVPRSGSLRRPRRAQW